MSKKITVSDDLKLPADVVTLASAVVGVRGSGKTNTAVIMVEDLLEHGYQVIVMDPLDVWWGLKSSADGQREAYPITVLGGIHGEVPLTDADGKVVADFLVDNPAPAILSMRHLPKSAQRRLVTDFAERLFLRKGESGKNTPVLIVVDEASQFVPQKVMGEDARMVGAIQNWVRLGRASGIGAVLIDQRPASINKDVLSQIELLIAHRVTSPQDRKALREWVDGHASTDESKDFWDTITTVARGEAWFWSPEWLKLFQRVKVRERRTFDSSATPKLGDKKVEPKRLAAADLAQLKGKLAATIEKAKADDPKELRKQIAELQRQVSAKPSTTPTAKSADTSAEIARAVAAAKKQVIRALVPFVKQFAGDARRIEWVSQEVARHVQSNASSLKAFETFLESQGTAELPAPKATTITENTPAAAIASRPTVRQELATADGLTKPQQRILDAFAWWHSIGVEHPGREQVAPLAGYGHCKSRGFTDPLYAVQAAGLVQDNQLTDEGREKANWPPKIDSLDQYLNKIRATLPGPAVKLFNELHGLGGKTTRDELSRAAGYTHPKSRGFTDPLYTLGNRGFITYGPGGTVNATELMYPPGLK